MHPSTDPWIWLAAILTLAILSYLYKDNPVYKTAEYLFVGIASGYYLSIYYANVIVPNLFQPVGRGVGSLFQGVFDPVGIARLGALVLGLMLFSRFVPRHSWPSRWPMGLLVGAYSGLAVIGFAQGDLIAQIRDNLMPLMMPGAIAALGDSGTLTGTLMEVLNLFSNAILIAGLLATLYYFFFSQEHRGLGGGIARLGVWLLMISFGASYGFTVMARVSLALDRLRFLFSDWLGLPLIR